MERLVLSLDKVILFADNSSFYSSFKDIVKGKMEQRDFYTHKVIGSEGLNTILEHKVQMSKRYTATELKCIKANVEQDR